jgi:hypothetical protein
MNPKLRWKSISNIRPSTLLPDTYIQLLLLSNFRHINPVSRTKSFADRRLRHDEFAILESHTLFKLRTKADAFKNAAISDTQSMQTKI